MDGMLCSSAPLPTWCTTLRMSDASTKRNLLFINNDLGQAIGLVRARRPTQLERIGDWNTRSLANCRRSANRYKMVSIIGAWVWFSDSDSDSSV